MTEDSLHDRLAQIGQSRTYKTIGDMTKTHPETVRRYMQGQSPSICFVTRLCAAFEISPTWLLLGSGPQTLAEVNAHERGRGTEGGPDTEGERFAGFAGALTTLVDRMSGVERLMQKLDERWNTSAEQPAADIIAVKPGDDARAYRVESNHRQSPHGTGDAGLGRASAPDGRTL